MEIALWRKMSGCSSAVKGRRYQISDSVQAIIGILRWNMRFIIGRSEYFWAERDGEVLTDLDIMTRTRKKRT